MDAATAESTPLTLQKPELQAQVVAALQRVLPPESLLWTPEQTTPYECDGLTAYRQRPLAVALPASYEQIQQVLRTCHALGVPVVALGIPTVVSSRVLGGTAEEMYVTPREIDQLINRGAKLLGMSINVCLQRHLQPRDLYTLVG